jgi:hypothetical protein
MWLIRHLSNIYRKDIRLPVKVPECFGVHKWFLGRDSLLSRLSSARLPASLNEEGRSQKVRGWWRVKIDYTGDIFEVRASLVGTRLPGKLMEPNTVHHDGKVYWCRLLDRILQTRSSYCVQHRLLLVTADDGRPSQIKDTATPKRLTAKYSPLVIY